MNKTDAESLAELGTQDEAWAWIDQLFRRAVDFGAALAIVAVLFFITRGALRYAGLI